MASKIKYEDVKNEVEQSGWKLISTAYTNLKESLELLCPEGHSNFVSFGKFRKGNYSCPICQQNKYYTNNCSGIKKTGYRILAFDQASITSGWAIFDDENLIKYGKWTSEGTDSTNRIAKTKYWVASMIQKYDPDEVILEDIQLQKFGDGEEAVVVYKKLAHLQGVLMNYCFESGIPFKVVPPATWRANSKIKGKSRTEKKKSAQLKIKELYDVSVSQDEADAILIGKWGAEENKNDEMIEF